MESNIKKQLDELRVFLEAGKHEDNRFAIEDLLSNLEKTIEGTFDVNSASEELKAERQNIINHIKSGDLKQLMSFFAEKEFKPQPNPRKINDGKVVNIHNPMKSFKRGFPLQTEELSPEEKEQRAKELVEKIKKIKNGEFKSEVKTILNDLGEKTEKEEKEKELLEKINDLKQGKLRKEVSSLTFQEEYKKAKDFPKNESENKSLEDIFEELEKKEKEDSASITFRIPKSTKDKLTQLVIKRSSDTGRILNFSSYIRLLIEKDFKERMKFK